MRAGVVVPDRRRGLLGLMLGLAVLAPLAAMATVKNVQQQQQSLRVKPQPSSSSGLPVPDLLESPDAKYDPKPKDIDAAALRLRLKGEYLLSLSRYPFFLSFGIDFIVPTSITTRDRVNI